MAEAPVGPEPDERPLVAVCLAPSDLRPEVDPLSGRTVIDARRSDMSASDAAALELGLQAAERWGGTVVAVSFGSTSVEPALRRALAVGAMALRVWPAGPEPHPAPGPQPVDVADVVGRAEVIAGSLAECFIASGIPDLILCGDRSALAGTSSVPAFLAAHLGAEQALGCVSVAFEAQSGTALVERRLDGGWKETLRVRTPGVVSLEAAGLRLRRASLSGTLSAAKADIPVFRSSNRSEGNSDTVIQFGSARPYRPRTNTVSPPDGDTRERLLALTGALSNREPPRIVGPLGASDAADELLEFLARHGYGESGI